MLAACEKRILKLAAENTALLSAYLLHLQLWTPNTALDSKDVAYRIVVNTKKVLGFGGEVTKFQITAQSKWL